MDQVWLRDITYVATAEGWSYLAVSQPVLRPNRRMVDVADPGPAVGPVCLADDARSTATATWLVTPLRPRPSIHQRRSPGAAVRPRRAC